MEEVHVRHTDIEHNVTAALVVCDNTIYLDIKPLLESMHYKHLTQVSRVFLSFHLSFLFPFMRGKTLPANFACENKRRQRVKETLAQDWSLAVLSIERKQNNGLRWSWLVLTAETLRTEDRPQPLRGRTGVTWLSLRFKTATIMLILFTSLVDMQEMLCAVQSSVCLFGIVHFSTQSLEL